MTTIEERSEYLKNPFFEKHIYGDWSPFYKTITVCMVFIVVLLVLNLLFGCASKYKEYWQDRNTGNRWIGTIWTATPTNQFPLDLTELEDVRSFQPINPDIEHPEVTFHRPQQEPRGYGRSYHHQESTEEFVELQHQKRESDI